MINQKFIKEHVNNLVELRDVAEIKLYCKSNGFEIKDQELERLRTSMQALVNKTADSRLLKLEDLANVSGGDLDKKDAQIIAGVLTLAGFAIGFLIPTLAPATSALKNFTGVLTMGGLSVGQLLGQGFVAAGEQSEMKKMQKGAALSYAESASGNNQCG